MIPYIDALWVSLAEIQREIELIIALLFARGFTGNPHYNGAYVSSQEGSGGDDRIMYRE